VQTADNRSGGTRHPRLIYDGTLDRTADILRRIGDLLGAEHGRRSWHLF